MSWEFYKLGLKHYYRIAIYKYINKTNLQMHRTIYVYTLDSISCIYEKQARRPPFNFQGGGGGARAFLK